MASFFISNIKDTLAAATKKQLKAWEVTYYSNRVSVN